MRLGRFCDCGCDVSADDGAHGFQGIKLQEEEPELVVVRKNLVSSLNNIDLDN